MIELSERCWAATVTQDFLADSVWGTTPPPGTYPEIIAALAQARGILGTTTDDG